MEGEPVDFRFDSGFTHCQEWIDGNYVSFAQAGWITDYDDSFIAKDDEKPVSYDSSLWTESKTSCLNWMSLQLFSDSNCDP